MNKKKTIFIAGGIFIAGLIISNLLSSQKQPMRRRPSPSGAKPVHLETVENQSLNTTIQLAGHLVALDKVDIYAEVSGVLLSTEKRFKEGNYFRKGQILVRIDDSVYRNNVLSQKSSLLNQLTLLLPDLSIDFPESAKRWEKYLSTLQMDKDLSPLPQSASEQERYYIASRNIYSQYYSIKSMEATLAKYTLEAPYDGVVTESNINPGTLVRMGQKLGAFTSTEIYEMEGFAGLNDAANLTIGQKVTLTCDDIPGQFDGKVQRINGVIDMASQTVKVYITTRDSRLKEGLYLNGQIQSNTIEDAYRVSRASLFGQNQVWVAEDSTMVLKPVSVVALEEKHAIVRGMENGTQVITDPPTDVYVGMPLPKPPQPRSQQGRQRPNNR